MVGQGQGYMEVFITASCGLTIKFSVKALVIATTEYMHVSTIIPKLL